MLIDRIPKGMINHFDDWEATEQIFDDNKAFWRIKKPNSEYQKVCLYRDGCNMFVYGDYGQFTFDSMTARYIICSMTISDIKWRS